MTGSGMTGRLVLVATPIGNLDDLSPRAVASLAEADVVVCEDSRRTGRLLERAGIGRRRLLIANEHTEAAAAAEVRRLLDGERRSPWSPTPVRRASRIPASGWCGWPSRAVTRSAPSPGRPRSSPPSR